MQEEYGNMDWQVLEDDSYVLDMGKSKAFIRKDRKTHFWKIFFEQGRVPGVLDGVFTTVFAAQRAMSNYSENK